MLFLRGLNDLSVYLDEALEEGRFDRDFLIAAWFLVRSTILSFRMT